MVTRVLTVLVRLTTDTHMQCSTKISVNIMSVRRLILILKYHYFYRQCGAYPFLENDPRSLFVDWVSLYFQHGTMHACDCRIAGEGEATSEREAQRQPIAHSVRVFNRNDRSGGGPRGEGLYRGVSTGDCSRSIHTLCCKTPSALGRRK